MSQIGTVLSGGANFISNIVTDSGTVSPSGGNINIAHDGNITVSEVANKATISLNNTITVDSAAIGNLLYSTNVISNATSDENIILTQSLRFGYVTQFGAFFYIGPNDELEATPQEVIPGGKVGVPSGKIMIGATGDIPLPNFLTAGPGISIDNFNASIPSGGFVTINSSGVGGGYESWNTMTYSGRSSETQEYTMEKNKAYIGNGIASTSEGQHAQILFNLPDTDTLSVGNSNLIISMGSSGCVIRPQSDQLIYFSQYPCIAFNPLFFNYLDLPHCEYPKTIGPYGSSEAQSIGIMYVGTNIPRFPVNKAIFLVITLDKVWTWKQYTEGPLGDGV